LTAVKSQASIAKQLYVSPSTISREVRRNSTQTPYKADEATKKSDTRRAQAREFCKSVVWLSKRIPVWLEHGMSPEQISERLKQEQLDHAVSHEWIYRFIATDKRCGGTLYLYLRHRRKRYRKRYESHYRLALLRNRVSIIERPAEV
jgi:IS30 family transposase